MDSDPVGIASMARCSRAPRRMIEPLPNWRSICDRVPSIAFKRSNLGSAMESLAPRPEAFHPFYPGFVVGSLEVVGDDVGGYSRGRRGWRQSGGTSFRLSSSACARPLHVQSPHAGLLHSP